MSFRNLLSLFFAILVAVPMVAVAFVFLSVTQDVEAGQADARLRGGFDTAVAVFDERRSDARRALTRIAADRRLGSALSEGDSARVRGRLETLARRERVIAVRLSGEGGDVAEVGAGDAVAFAIATPVGPGGRRLGTLSVSTTRGDAFVREVKRLSRLDVVVARGGERLAGTLAPGAVEVDRSGDVEIEGESWRGRFQRIRERRDAEPLSLGLFGKTSELASIDVAARQLAVGAILLAAFLLAFLGARVVVRALQGQIEQFLEAARRLGRGDFSHKVPTVGSDEFAALGHEFNSMSEQLESQMREVARKRRELEETIRRVGDAFAAGLDRRSSAELAVGTAVEACGADGGRITPIDRSKMEAVTAGIADGPIGAALTAAERESFKVRVEDRVELMAYLEGAPAESFEKRLVQVTVNGVHALAHPLRARLTAQSDVHYAGVLSIARSGEPFSPSEIDLFGYLAAQAGVSIENIDLHETVQRQAVTDELTGLFNVRHFQDTLEREIERSARFNYDIGLVMMDIDNFKSVNDTYGHQQGDLVLVEVARVLRNHSRDVDEPARYGGEEMAVILPQTDIEGAELQAERFRAAIERLEIPRLDGEGQLKVTASFGVASLPGEAVEKDGFIAAADAALYRAKRGGKNRVERAEPTPASR